MPIDTTYPPATSVQPFDVVFDKTFRSIILITPGSPVERCVQKGCYLTWLSRSGWAFWLFEGTITTDIEVSDRGTIARGGVTQSTQKESGQLLTIRSANLLPDIADAVATVYESPAVYMVLTDAAGKRYSILVSIDAGTFPVRESNQKRSVLEVKIKLPKTRSQRT